MFTKKEKIALAITGVEAVVIGIGAALCWGKACYHQGRIDARKETMDNYEKTNGYLEEANR